MVGWPVTGQCGSLRTDPSDEGGAHVQAQHLYPLIASRDRREQVFAYWLRSLNERNFHFSQWAAADFQEPARRDPDPNPKP